VSALTKLAAVLLAIIAVIAFINHGQLGVASGPSGAAFSGAYYGLVK
jgi:uncharacterized membrane protein